MLEFWFDRRISSIQKIITLIITLALVAVLYYRDPLPLPTLLMFTGSGLVFLICRYLKLQFAVSNPTGLLYRLLTWIPIAIIFALLFVQTMNHLISWGIQGLAFMALTVFVFSPQFLVKNSSPNQFD